MAARIITDIEELRELIGAEIGVSDWIEMTQERINTFADTTDDHQWIHIDRERAAKESPYGTTIAHGFLTLSLLSALIREVVVVNAGFKPHDQLRAESSTLSISGSRRLKSEGPSWTQISRGYRGRASIRVECRRGSGWLSKTSGGR